MERFWDKIDKNGPLILKTRCWVWTAFKTHEGYGKCHLKGVSQYATRAAWELTKGPIPKGLLTCHKCDNPACVRPGHIYLGTNKDNRLDCTKKDRCYKGGKPPKLPGEKHGNHVLTEAAIKHIRSSYCGRHGQMTSFATRYGVSRTAIYLVLKGKNWKHV